jgi:hypothetical protein
LAKAYEGLIIRQNEIYDAVHLGVEKMARAQFEKHSDIVIQSQVFAANVQAAFVVMKVQSTKAYEEQPSANKSNVLEKPGEPFQLCSIIGNKPKNALPSKCIPNPRSRQMFR